MAFLGDGMGKAHENAMLMKMGKRPLDGAKPRGDCFNVGWGRDLHPSQAVDCQGGAVSPNNPWPRPARRLLYRPQHR